MGLADDVRQVAAPPVYPREQRLRVSAVGDDGLTVNLDPGDGQPINTVLCLASYVDRAVGDLAVVFQFGPASTSWVVIGAYGKQAPDWATSDDVTAMIKSAINKLTIPDVPPTVTVLKGSGAPSGTGWVQATDYPYWRDDGNGARSIYIPTGNPDSGSSGPVKPPPQPATPDPVTITPNAIGSYRPGGQTDPGLIQGAWTGQQWTAALFYGTKIADACSGNTVAKMELTLSRLNDSSGWNRAVAVHIGTHGQASKSKVTSLNNVSSFAGLQHGQRRTYTLTNAQVNALKSGSARGLGMGGTSDYVKFTSGSGSLKITFS